MGKKVVVSNYEIFLFYKRHCSCDLLEIHLNFVYVMLIATNTKNIKIVRLAYGCLMWFIRERNTR